MSDSSVPAELHVHGIDGDVLGVWRGTADLSDLDADEVAVELPEDGPLEPGDAITLPRGQVVELCLYAGWAAVKCADKTHVACSTGSRNP